MMVWQFVLQKMNAGNRVVLLYVLESKGSSPGRQGFHMAVADDGSMQGSIGGGIMEHKFVEYARHALKMNHALNEIIQQVHDKEEGKNRSGMICSGEQTIFLYCVLQKDKPAIEVLCSSKKGMAAGSLILSKAGLQVDQKKSNQNYTYHYNRGEFIYTEKLGFKNTIHIIGGGHCALALSKLMRDMDFYIMVYDDRPGLHTLVQNRYAHQIITVPAYKSIATYMNACKDDYVVIMTFGYRTDDEVIQALASHPFKYAGALGSAFKMKQLFEKYRELTITGPFIDQLHTPIGLAIHSQTPEEIAISIAAEIIQVKNKPV